MSYNIQSESQSTTLTPAEMSDEARRTLEFLQREVDFDDVAEMGTKFGSDRAVEFLVRLAQELGLAGRVVVSVKQLFWLRDLASKV